MVLLFRKSWLLLLAASSISVSALSPRRQTVSVPSSSTSQKKKVRGNPTIGATGTSSTVNSRLAHLKGSAPIRGGGATQQQSDVPTRQEMTGVVTLILIEVAFRKAFQARNIRFPAQLAGCVALFVAMVLADCLPGGDDGAVANNNNFICQALSPGAGLLAKWMGVFFVPGLTMLPLAPLDAIGSSVEMAKALGVVIVGFFYSLGLVTYSVLGVRKLLGKSESESESSNGEEEEDGALNVKPAAAPPSAHSKPYASETQFFLIIGTIVSAVVSLVVTRQKLLGDYQKPLETLFLLFTTLASYVWGARLPGSITNIVNPLLTSAAATMGVARLLGMASGRTLVEVLQGYTCKQLAPMQAGAGDLLLFLLSPSVISFAVGMYKGKTLIANNLPAILTGVATGSVGSLFGTAAVCRLIRLGGPQGGVLRLAAVPRSTQTALGMIIAEMLGGDVAIAATLIILTGIFGGMVGVKTLNAWGVKDPVSRGLGIGSAGLSLGVVSIKQEPEAFAFAGVCLVLTAVAATCLASIPAVADLLKAIAGGSAIVLASAATVESNNNSI